MTYYITEMVEGEEDHGTSIKTKKLQSHQIAKKLFWR